MHDMATTPHDSPGHSDLIERPADRRQVPGPVDTKDRDIVEPTHFGSYRQRVVAMRSSD
jgi:hypothetical protein